MRQPAAIRMAILLFWATLVVCAYPPARADILLETATPGPSPTPAVGLGALQWIGARFTVDQPVLVDQIGANLAALGDNLTIFGAIVPLSGPGGLPALPPSQIESYALAGTSFLADAAVADYSTPLPVALGPGEYGVVFGIGPFGSSGGANLTTGNIPTTQASFFSAVNIIGDEWVDRPDLTGLRIFVIGTQSVPEPAAWITCGTGLITVVGLALRRRRRMGFAGWNRSLARRG